MIRELATKDARVRGYSLSRNFGHQAALSAGLEHARGDAVVTLDSDMQHPPGLIPALVMQWRAGFEIVQTIRADDSKLTWFKRISSSLFYRAMGYFSDVEIRPAAADFRLHVAAHCRCPAANGGVPSVPARNGALARLPCG